MVEIRGTGGVSRSPSEFRKLKMKKYGIDKTTEVVKIHRKDWEKIAELASLRGCSMADATHELLEKGIKQSNNQPRNEGNKIGGLLVKGNKIVSVLPDAQTRNEGVIPAEDIMLLPIGRIGIKKGTRVRGG